MIRTHLSRKSRKQLKPYLSIGDIRKLGRNPDLSWDQIIDSPKIKIKIPKSILKKPKERDNSHQYNRLKTMAEEANEELPENYKFETIVASKIIGGRLHHLVKWREINNCSLIDSNEVNRRWPQEVIKYYQKHLFFTKEFVKN